MNLCAGRLNVSSLRDVTLTCARPEELITTLSFSSLILCPYNLDPPKFILCQIVGTVNKRERKTCPASEWRQSPQTSVPLPPFAGQDKVVQGTLHFSFFFFCPGHYGWSRNLNGQETEKKRKRNWVPWLAVASQRTASRTTASSYNSLNEAQCYVSDSNGPIHMNL